MKLNTTRARIALDRCHTKMRFDTYMRKQNFKRIVRPSRKLPNSRWARLEAVHERKLEHSMEYGLNEHRRDNWRDKLGIPFAQWPMSPMARY
jgi:hypothetical protein